MSTNAVYALMHWYNKFAIVSILDMYPIYGSDTGTTVLEEYLAKKNHFIIIIII